jgi:hypothetical protein
MTKNSNGTSSNLNKSFNTPGKRGDIFRYDHENGRCPTPECFGLRMLPAKKSTFLIRARFAVIPFTYTLSLRSLSDYYDLPLPLPLPLLPTHRDLTVKGKNAYCTSTTVVQVASQRRVRFGCSRSKGCLKFFFLVYSFLVSRMLETAFCTIKGHSTVCTTTYSS